VADRARDPERDEPRVPPLTHQIQEALVDLTGTDWPLNFDKLKDQTFDLI